MEIMGIAITILGLILGYIWRSNGRLQKIMMEALLRLEEGQKEIAQGQREIAQMAREIAKMASEAMKYLADLSARG